MVSLQGLFVLVCVVITSQTSDATVAGRNEITPRKQVIKQSCRYDRDCPKHAFCQSQMECACKEGYFIHKEENRNEICLKRSEFSGDRCEVDAQCQLALGPSAECRRMIFAEHDFQCTCREYAHLVDGRCYNTSRVGEKCVSKNNCLMDGGPLLSCMNDICICPRNQHASTDRSRCVEDRGLGETCLEDDECVPTNSRCADVCECRIHYVANAWNRRCIPVADSVDDPCEEDLQCRFVPNSQCSRDLAVCTCLDGYHPGPKGARCYRDVRLADGCDDKWECIVTPEPLIVPYNFTPAECYDNKCRCSEGFSVSDDGAFCENASTQTRMASVLLLLMIVITSLQA